MAQANAKRPNILVIWGDDVGMWNISAYHRGMMGGSTPNIDRIANEGMIFMDHYAEASCTAGRAAFITGQYPIRVGLATVGLPGSEIGLLTAANPRSVVAGAKKQCRLFSQHDVDQEDHRASELHSMPAGSTRRGRKPVAY